MKYSNLNFQILLEKIDNDFIMLTASLKPKSVSVKVPRKGALNIDMGRYGDSKNGFG